MSETLERLRRVAVSWQFNSSSKANWEVKLRRPPWERLRRGRFELSRGAAHPQAGLEGF